MKSVRGALFGAVCLFAACGATAAAAQVTPEQEASLRSVAKLFRATVDIGSGAGAFSDSFGFNEQGDARDFMQDSELRARYGARYTGVEAVRGVLDFRGVPIFGSYDAESTSFRIVVPAADQPGAPGQPYTRVFTGPTREAAYQAFKDFFDEDIEDAEAEYLIQALLRALAGQSPVDPLAGNPDSLQGALVRSALDLSEGDSAIEGGAESAADDPWLVGLSYTRADTDRYTTDRISGRIQRSFRVLEGRRALLKLELPFSYLETSQARTGSVALGAALEVPLIQNRWSLEPRVSVGATISELASAGWMVSASLGSRYKIDNVGRGYLLIGNMVGYTSTLPAHISSEMNLDPGLENWVFRNGLAYELPLNGQVLGRGASLRASYTFTNFTGDDLYLDKFHEVTLSFGVRNREGVARNVHDLLRVNTTATFGDNYQAYSIGLGYRF